MRKSTFLATSLLALNLTLVFGQQTPPPATPFPANAFQPPNFSPGSRLRPAAEDPTLAKFNLDFPGGTPIELVAAIEKATGKPLNAIIPKEDADLQMPPLKMSDVAVPQLFAALKAASQKQITVSRVDLEPAIPHTMAIMDLKLGTMGRMPQFGIFT